MEKKPYVSPSGKELATRLLLNAMSPGPVDSIYDQGLPNLEADNTTLDWINS